MSSDVDTDDSDINNNKRTNKKSKTVSSRSITHVSTSAHYTQLMRKKASIDPANVAVNDNIRALKAEWACNKSDCSSDFCWISPENDVHLPLGNSHFTVWASGMV